MGVILFVLLLALLLSGPGFAARALRINAAVVSVAWLIGSALADGELPGGRRARWYRR